MILDWTLQMFLGAKQKISRCRTGKKNPAKRGKIYVKKTYQKNLLELPGKEKLEDEDG